MRTSPAALGSLLLLTGCWARSPGPVALATAQGPVEVVEERVPARGTTFSLAMRAGSAHDPDGQEGLAWLTAHAIALGGTQGRTAADVQRDLYALGTELQVDVGPEIVTFTLQCGQADAAACGELLAELVTAPSLDQPALDRARAQALAKLDAVVVGPARPLAELAFSRVVYAGHPYGHADVGRHGALDTLSAVDLQRFHAQRYLRPAATLGLVGEPEVEVVVDVQAAFAALPPRLYEDVTPRSVPAVQGRRLVVVQAPVDETWVLVGHGTDLGPGDPDRLAVEAGMDILGDGPGSRLDRALRVSERSEVLFDAALGDGQARVQPALRLALRPNQVQATLPTVAAALRELERLVAEGPTEDELLRWKRIQTGRDSASAASPTDRVDVAASAQLLGGQSLWQRAAAVQALTVDQVAQALAAHVHPQDLHLVVVTSDPTPFQALAPQLAAALSSVEGSSPWSVDEVEPAAVADYGVGVTDVSVLSSAELLR